MSRSVEEIRNEFPEGSGFFETLLTQERSVAELNRHMRRALHTAEVLNIAFPSENHLLDLISQTFQGEVFPSGRMRMTFGSGDPHIHYAPYIPSTHEARLTFATESSTSEGEQLKTFPYDHRFSIVQAAHDLGFDDAIVFNKKNEVTESGFSNIVFWIGDQWVTPPISAGILPGVMRALAIERCDIQVRNIHISEMSDVRGALLLSSLRIAQPVSHIGDYQLPDSVAMRTLAAEVASKVEYFSVV